MVVPTNIVVWEQFGMNGCDIVFSWMYKYGPTADDQSSRCCVAGIECLFRYVPLQSGFLLSVDSRFRR